jgi:GT2 family glycosyltransferase
MHDPSKRQIAALQRLIAKMRQRVDFVEGSAFWKLRARYFALKARFGFVHDPAPPPIPEREYVETQSASDPYTAWLLEHEPRRSDLARLGDVAFALAARPTFELVVDDAQGGAEATLESVASQVYAPVTTLRTSELADGAATAVARLNAALERSTAEWIAFLESDIVLAPDAIFDVAVASLRDPSADAFFSDRDEYRDDGSRGNPTFTTELGPESLLSTHHTGDVVFYRVAAVRELGGFAEVRSFHFDLALRAWERGVRFSHRPRVLWHRRIGNGAAAAPRWDDDATVVSLACERRGIPARTTRFRDYDGAVIPRFDLRSPGRADIVIPTRDHADDLETTLETLFTRTRGIDFRVTIVDNGSTEAATAALFARYVAHFPGRFTVVRVDDPFNFSQLINVGARATDGPYLVSLNNDTEILDGDWLASMLEYAQLPGIGAVGARLLYGDGTIQHAGVVVGLGQLAGHVYRFASPDDPGPDGALFSVRNYSAVTAAAVAFRRDAFEAIGGFDERFAVEFNDVDFCLRLGEAGLRSVYLPHVEIRHYESKSRGIPDTPQKRARVAHERALFEARWHSSSYRDPYYNPNLTLLDESGSLDA